MSDTFEQARYRDTLLNMTEDELFEELERLEGCMENEHQPIKVLIKLAWQADELLQHMQRRENDE